MAIKRAWKAAHPDSVKQSQRWAYLKWKLGITREQYEEKLSNQEGLCAICRSFVEVLEVDHCHSTGQVRGLLCGSCNKMLGSAKDSPATLQNAIAYLDYHQGGY